MDNNLIKVILNLMAVYLMMVSRNDNLGKRDLL